jgi:MoaA/NifB/PqqE/SkfB family radical SAM enzyme
MDQSVDYFFSLDRGINLDISNKCPLECYACDRQRGYRNHGLKVPGADMTIAQFKKILPMFRRILFAGNLSDPISNPLLIDFLKLCKQHNKPSKVVTSASHRPLEWYAQAFESNPSTQWIFGLDGLPEESCLYRINQDGEKIYQAIKLAVSMNMHTTWQYIIFSYNEDHIEQAKEMAHQIGCKMELVYSPRFGTNDPYRPKNHEIKTKLP